MIADAEGVAPGGPHLGRVAVPLCLRSSVATFVSRLDLRQDRFMLAESEVKRAAQLNLALFSDDEGNSVRITVLGALPGLDGGLAAEIVVDTPFVTGRVGLPLWRSRLTSWGEALDRLEAGEDIAWLDVQRGPSVFIHLSGERDCPEVVVEDDLVSMVTVRVPIDLPADWIAAHRRLPAPYSVPSVNTCHRCEHRFSC